MLGITQVCLDVQLQNTCTASDEHPRLGSIQYRPAECLLTHYLRFVCLYIPPVLSELRWQMCWQLCAGLLSVPVESVSSIGTQCGIVTELPFPFSSTICIDQ